MEMIDVLRLIFGPIFLGLVAIFWFIQRKMLSNKQALESETVKAANNLQNILEELNANMETTNFVSGSITTPVTPIPGQQLPISGQFSVMSGTVPVLATPATANYIPTPVSYANLGPAPASYANLGPNEPYHSITDGIKDNFNWGKTQEELSSKESTVPAKPNPIQTEFGRKIRLSEDSSV